MIYIEVLNEIKYHVYRKSLLLVQLVKWCNLGVILLACWSLEFKVKPVLLEFKNNFYV